MLSYLIRLFKTLTATERGVFYTFAVIAAASGIITTWNLLTLHTTIAPARGGEYTEGLVGQPTAINPMYIGSSPVDRDLVTALFADLGTLTERYATSSTGKVWLLTLKTDMVWSDDKPITSDDVVFTIHTIQHPDAGSSLFNSWQGVTVERVSELQVRFTLKAPYSYFADALKELRIAPAHVFENIPISNIRLSDYNIKPVTSGPYNFTSFEKKNDGYITHYNVTANNNYPGTRALIEKINFAFFSTYQDAIIAFNQKQIDGLGGISPESVDELKINHSLIKLPLPQYYGAFFNPTVNPVLKDVTVRTALTLATDRNAIISEVFSDAATPIAGPLGAQMTDYASSTYETDHSSAEEAKALLAKQGWRIGADGVQTRTVGKTTQRLDLQITTPNLPFLTQTADLIKQQWQAIGVKVSIITIDTDEIEAKAVTPRAYQILLFGNILRGNSDLFSFWHSSQQYAPGLNLAMYNNKNVDKLIELARSTFDLPARADALAKIQTQLFTDKPAIFLYSPLYLYAAPTDLGGVARPMIATPADRLANVYEWYLKTARVFKDSSSTQPQ